MIVIYELAKFIFTFELSKNERTMKRPEISEYIKKDPSELSNGELLIGYQKYAKAMGKYADHIEKIIHETN